MCPGQSGRAAGRSRRTEGSSHDALHTIPNEGRHDELPNEEACGMIALLVIAVLLASVWFFSGILGELVTLYGVVWVVLQLL